MTLKEQLADAQKQYHLLVTGQAARVYVDQNGERVEYVAANSSRLQQYIARLEGKIAEAAGASGPSGPMRVFF